MMRMNIYMDRKDIGREQLPHSVGNYYDRSIINIFRMLGQRTATPLQTLANA